MDAELKRVVIPVLRELGFKGTYPHFYRERRGHVDLLSFQFRLSGGSFVAELSFADQERSNIYFDKTVSASKLRVVQASKRLRLGSALPENDHWFSFETSGWLSRSPSYEKIARSVAALLMAQGDQWWRSQESVS
ncbi:MAG: DUF4304 domain-containing protein [Flavobacteriales bacterium]|nr:DUF4304 domain-containing protein [Flavobacteriales bacterium]